MLMQVGWKIGATSKTAQDRLGVSQPFFAPVMASDVVAVDAPPEALREVRTGLGEEGEPGSCTRCVAQQGIQLTHSRHLPMHTQLNRCCRWMPAWCLALSVSLW